VWQQSKEEFKRGSSKQKEEEAQEQPTALQTNCPPGSRLRPRGEIRMMGSLLLRLCTDDDQALATAGGSHTNQQPTLTPVSVDECGDSTMSGRLL
jgi:hypothetical protein